MVTVSKFNLCFCHHIVKSFVEQMAEDTNKFRRGASGQISSKDLRAFLRDAVKRIFVTERGKQGG